MPPVIRLDSPRKGTLVLTLNRPEASNAINEIVMAELELALDRIDRDPRIRVLILTGEGDRAFCAGGDLKYFKTLETAEQARQMSQRMQRILTRFWLGDRVVIAAVNGAAVGGGFEIVTAAHLRVCAEAATFQFVQARKGLVTGWGGAARLMRMIGRDRALDLLLTARRLDAREAHTLGVVTRVLPADLLLSEAVALASSICEFSSTAIRSFLTMASCSEEPWLREALAKENELFGDCWSSPEFQAALHGVSSDRDTS